VTVLPSLKDQRIAIGGRWLSHISGPTRIGFI